MATNIYFGIALLMASLPAFATVIVVDSTVTDPFFTDACTITSAVLAADTRTVQGTCPAGSGLDTIVLPSDAVFSFDNGHFGSADNPAALPDIVSDIRFVGNNAPLLSTLDSCVPSLPTPVHFRWFNVFEGGHLSLSDISLVGGCMLDYQPGGSIVVDQGALDLDHTTIRNSFSDRDGGAIYSVASAGIAIRDSSFTGNSVAVAGSGGAIYSQTETSVDRTYFGANTAYEGSAIYSNFGRLSIVNSTFDGNISDSGSAVQAVGPAEISFSTFSGNLGAALASGSETTIVASILTAGRGGLPNSNCKLLDRTGSVPKLTILGSTYSDDSSCGAATVVDRSDLDMGVIGNYGGDTLTIPLLPGSVAIDSVEDCYGVAGPVIVDQRGFPRPAVYGAGCDAGAYEYDGVDHSPPLQQFGAGDLLLSLEDQTSSDKVSEYTRAGQLVRDIWYPLRSPSDYGIRGIAADGLGTFGVFLGTYMPALGRYEVGDDRWSFAVDTGWSVYTSGGSIAHVGSRW
ncbi:MAG: choice-of-anchor Q domain-containing protein, partial [Rhodanobacteraceae bacterium]